MRLNSLAGFVSSHPCYADADFAYEAIRPELAHPAGKHRAGSLARLAARVVPARTGPAAGHAGHAAGRARDLRVRDTGPEHPRRPGARDPPPRTPRVRLWTP